MVNRGEAVYYHDRGAVAVVMNPPGRHPPRIRTDSSNPFAHHTVAVRLPKILDGVIERNQNFLPAVRDAVLGLRDELAGNARLSPIDPALPHAETWARELGRRDGERWQQTDWLFAETYAYRCLVDRVDFWATGRDPFASHKHEEYRSAAHAQALERALAISGTDAERLYALLGAALWGNRIDLSFEASRTRGTAAAGEDLLVDDREAAVRSVFDGTGPVQIVADNAGTELTTDLLLADFFLHALGADVIVHVKVHPTFVSDATAADVHGFLRGASSGAPAFDRLRAALTRGRLRISAHPFWNSSLSLWELPYELESVLRVSRLVVLKGDANYRRALGDAIWPLETSFSAATDYFPAPLLALRTLKSDPIVGLSSARAGELDGLDPAWRVNGKRGIASFGGAAAGRLAA
jgi:hypothetical protein